MRPLESYSFGVQNMYTISIAAGVSSALKLLDSRGIVLSVLQKKMAANRDCRRVQPSVGCLACE